MGIQACHIISAPPQVLMAKPENAVKVTKSHSRKHFETEEQRAKKVVFDSPGLVDFAMGLVNSVFNLPDGQMTFFEEFE